MRKVAHRREDIIETAAYALVLCALTLGLVGGLLVGRTAWGMCP